MDCRAVLLWCCLVIVALLLSAAEGRKKKVVIHVPIKLKKIKHTHTVYKTIHHHHTHREPPLLHHEPPLLHHVPAATEEHEHFHHVHVHEEPRHHAQAHAVPDFLPPEGAMELPMQLPDLPLDLAPLHNRHMIPLYRRA